MGAGLAGSGGEVLRRWGHPRSFKPGDQTQLGMVIDVKPPPAKVQVMADGRPVEQWVKVIELRPASAMP